MKGSRSGLIMDIDHFAVHDGPGIRTAIFLKGCPLTCDWCHSPESQSRRPEILFAPSRCHGCRECCLACPLGLHQIDRDGIHYFNREQCMQCGACVKACVTGALFCCGRYMSVDDLLREVVPDQPFYDNSGGGVTVTGGEVLMQAAFVRDFLDRLRMQGIHSIVETSGYGSGEALLDLAEVTDLFYYDFKLADLGEFSGRIGGDGRIPLKNLALLRQKTDAIVLRIPLIPGITDQERNIRAAYDLAGRLDIGTIHLLPYNPSAPAKYEWCGRTYPAGKLAEAPRQYEKLLAMAPRFLQVIISG